MKHTDFMFQRNYTNHNYVSQKFFPSKAILHTKENNAELEIQFLNTTVADVQNQINIITPGSGEGDPNEPDIGYA